MAVERTRLDREAVGEIPVVRETEIDLEIPVREDVDGYDPESHRDRSELELAEGIRDLKPAMEDADVGRDLAIIELDAEPGQRLRLRAAQSDQGAVQVRVVEDELQADRLHDRAVEADQPLALWIEQDRLPGATAG